MYTPFLRYKCNGRSIGRDQGSMSLIADGEGPQAPGALTLLVHRTNRQIRHVFIITNVSNLPSSLAQLTLFSLSTRPVREHIVICVISIGLIVSNENGISSIILNHVARDSLRGNIVHLISYVLTEVIE